MKDFVALVGKVLADNVVDADSSLVYGKAGEKLSTAMLKRILDTGVQSLKIAVGADENHPIIKMLAKDPTDLTKLLLKIFIADYDQESLQL